MANKEIGAESLLNLAERLQEETSKSVIRIARDISHSEELADISLLEVRRQKRQIDDIKNELEQVHSRIETSKGHLKSYERYRSGYIKRMCRFIRRWVCLQSGDGMKDTSWQAQHLLEIRIAGSRRKQGTNSVGSDGWGGRFIVEEIFEQQYFSPLLLRWRSKGIVLCSDSSLYICEEDMEYLKQQFRTFFSSDSTKEAVSQRGKWIVDFSAYSSLALDAEGWTYAPKLKHLHKPSKDKAASSSSSARVQWNSFYRRRKWVYRYPTAALKLQFPNSNSQLVYKQAEKVPGSNYRRSASAPMTLIGNSSSPRHAQKNRVNTSTHMHSRSRNALSSSGTSSAPAMVVVPMTWTDTDTVTGRFQGYKSLYLSGHTQDKSQSGGLHRRGGGGGGRAYPVGAGQEEGLHLGTAHNNNSNNNNNNNNNNNSSGTGSGNGHNDEYEEYDEYDELIQTRLVGLATNDRSLSTALGEIEAGVDRLAVRSVLMNQELEDEHRLSSTGTSSIDQIGRLMRGAVVGQAAVNKKTRHFVDKG